MQTFTVTVPVTITFAMGTPQTHCVKLEIPPLVVPDAAPTIILPTFISRKRPSTITVSGQARTVSACVALLLESKRRGDKLRARPETIRKFEAELPELAGFLKRDESRKGHGGMVPVCFGVEVG